jgi:prepilin peptidase CpaA
MNMLTLLIVALGCAAVFDDLRRKAVSNWINVAALCIGLVYHALRGGLAGFGMAAAGAGLGLAVFFVFFWLGGMGGGDIKLMAAFGSLLGPSGILLTALFAAPIGALIAAAALLWNRHCRAIPYAPAIVLGAWLVWLGKG